MHSLFSVRRLFSSKPVLDTTVGDSSFVAHYSASTLQHATSKGETEISRSQAEKQSTFIENGTSDNAPMLADRNGRRPSSYSELEYNCDFPPPGEHASLPAEPLKAKTKVTNRRLGWRTIIPLFVALALLTLGLTIGLGVGLTVGKHKAPATIQRYGAINGSGIVALDLDNTTIITSYTQRYDGVIVKNQYIAGNWSGGTDIGDLVTADGNFNGETLVARNGTPLMALSYVNDNELTWHVFYVTADNYLSDWINSNITQGWYQGTLRSGNFAVSNSSHVGLSACVNTQWYGAPFNPASLGIRLYYGRSDNIIQELGWNLDGQTTWFNGSSFPNSNGAGGVECTVRGASITYVWLENLQGELQQMWYDFNTSAGTPTHKVGTWVSGLTYPDILHSSAISAINDFTATPPTKNVHFQAQDLSIVEIISNGTAENDTWERHFVVGTENGINGTRIGSVVLDTGLGGQEIHVIYQTNTTDMIDFIRDLTDPNWAIKPVPVGV